MPDTLTTELENAVEKGLAQGQNYIGHQQRMTGGARNGAVQARATQISATQISAPLADMLEAIAQHNEHLKMQLDQAIRDLQNLREQL